jgi:hypothetical protein
MKSASSPKSPSPRREGNFENYISPVCGCKAFSLLSSPKEDHEIILPALQMIKPLTCRLVTYRFFVLNKKHMRNNSLLFQLLRLKTEVIFSTFEESIYYSIEKWIVKK